MDNIKEQENVIKSGLYSERQLFITATIGGPAIAAFIISCNLWATEKRSFAIIPVLPGLILSFVILFSVESVFHFITSHYPHFITSIVLRHIAAFALYFLLLTGFAIIIRFILKNKTLVLATILFTIVCGVTILVIGTHINNNPVINKYSITIPKKSSTLNSLKVISVSDLHLKNITSTVFLKKLADKIRSENPDIIFLPGDIAETYGNTTEENLNLFIEILKDIKSDYGIHAVRGNHDLPRVNVADKIDFNRRLGITLLADSLIELDNKIYILGLKYRGNNEKRPIDSLLRSRTKDLPVILLDHAPYCLEEACKNKIDVQLSGHTHYGQIWPLNYVTDAVYDIAWGYKKIESTNIFVSCGVQDAILPGSQDLSMPVRIGSVSEILEINIEFR